MLQELSRLEGDFVVLREELGPARQLEGNLLEKFAKSRHDVTVGKRARCGDTAFKVSHDPF